ncbi:JAB-like toxin 1 domain-containing protein [Sphingobacterium faecium]|uniref:JAB-like toxin 1 domain-containing protein n=1 Tax=Sphingobacterium faecium TaxID=34087 RepID=UPI0024697893|nr:JAB-like toxin 1 domain-containing protein [Sphingobacterium faecium]MDH5826434.1 JAB-like toxin 1 domain-containing protein [Sphingobacterium faecium]
MLEDDYTLDDIGAIKLVRKTDDSFDRLIKVDKSGEETKKSITVKKDILNNIKDDKSVIGKKYNYLNIKDGATATNLFEFLATNSKVEWSLIKSKGEGSFISTSHENTVEGGNPHVMAKLYRDRTKVSENIHSHPGQYTEGPSGFASFDKGLPASDRKQAQSMSKYFPETIFNVFRVFNKTYIRYDKNKIYNK